VFVSVCSSSLVDDGVCDCCDGSDERITAASASASHVQCPNVCAEKREQFIAEETAKIQQYKAALRNREVRLHCTYLH
jgi:hypothetical protein